MCPVVVDIIVYAHHERYDYYVLTNLVMIINVRGVI